MAIKIYNNFPFQSTPKHTKMDNWCAKKPSGNPGSVGSVGWANGPTTLTGDASKKIGAQQVEKFPPFSFLRCSPGLPDFS
jgi:hypothetical protein